MRNRTKVLIVVAAVGAVAALIAWLAHDPEPSYMDGHK